MPGSAISRAAHGLNAPRGRRPEFSDARTPSWAIDFPWNRRQFVSLDTCRIPERPSQAMPTAVSCKPRHLKEGRMPWRRRQLPAAFRSTRGPAGKYWQRQREETGPWKPVRPGATYVWFFPVASANSGLILSGLQHRYRHRSYRLKPCTNSAELRSAYRTNRASSTNYGNAVRHALLTLAGDS